MRRKWQQISVEFFYGSEVLPVGHTDDIFITGVLVGLYLDYGR